MCVDMEREVIDSLRVGRERELYEGNHLIAGKNSEIVEVAMDPIRKMVEKC